MMRLMRFRRRWCFAAICRARTVLATARSIGAIVVTLAWAGAESVVAIAPIRAVRISTALQADQTVLVGVAADQTIAAIELRCAHIPTGVHLHRVARAVELDARRAAPTVSTGLAITTVDRVVIAVIAALPVVQAHAITADVVLAAVAVLKALDTNAFVADATRAVAADAAPLADPAAANEPRTAIVSPAAFCAGAAVGLLVIAAMITIAT
jgi:hypothetical protein